MGANVRTFFLESEQKGDVANRLRFRNPPVYEVILDLQFQSPLELPELQNLQSTIGDVFGDPQPITRVSTDILTGARGVSYRAPESALWGWEFFQEEPRRHITVSANQITQHFQRSPGDPAERYVGWEANAAAFVELVGRVTPVFETQSIKRAGLRYVNRVAIPKDSRLEEWFSVAPTPLAVFEGVWDFTVSRTWQRAPGYPGLSGTVTLTKLDMLPEELADDDVLGVGLDIDIFNLWVRDAPKLSEVPEWIERAHDLENQVFRQCIRAPLRERFGPLP